VPFDIFYNILKDRFNGTLYPVSPGKKSIASVPAYKYVLDIDGEVDLAILVFPSNVCHKALEQCGEKGVKGVIIISAGFREVGEAGKTREKQIKEIAEKYGMSFIGPNCLGVINTDPESNLNASFARKMPSQGDIAFLSQSGALCTAVLDYAQGKNIGFSKFVSFGNKADISEIDLIYYLKDDPKTKVILLYLEEVTDGRALMKAAKDVITETGKPILLIKSGRSGAGAAAAASHTGSLAGSDDVCDAAMRQAGVIRCYNIEEMFNKAVALSYQPLPQGRNVAIITNAGGPGVLATDRAIFNGLELGKFSEETTAEFKKHLPKTANIKNPVDVIGDAHSDRYNVAIKGAMEDDGIDGVGVILTPQSMTDIVDIAENIADRAQNPPKPIYASFMGEMDVAAGIDILQNAHVPHYIIPEDMMDALHGTADFREKKEKLRNEGEAKPIQADVSKANSLLNQAIKDGRHHLPEKDALQVLEAFGLPVLPHALAQTEDEAAIESEKLGYPVVLKVVSDDIIHKSDMGGVIVNCKNADEVKAAFAQIKENVNNHHPDAKLDGILVEKMAEPGEEVILGLKNDPSFGPVMLFGLGGTFVEIFKDVTFRVPPVSRASLEEMIQEIKAYPLLKGARGKAPKDQEALITCLENLANLALSCPQIKELDINPLIVGNEGKGCAVADARIML
jgi:acetyltransferase